MSFEFQKQKIEDVVLIKPKVYQDNRGCFVELFKKSEFQKHGIIDEFKQDNCSVSSKHVLRGLHYQKKPYGQAKLIQCIKGEIIDIALDIRLNSKTFGKYVKTKLSKENNQILYIPEGFAHGFISLSDEAIVTYKVTNEYNPNSQKGIFWADSDLEIDWGIDFQPILSMQDKTLPELKNIPKEELF